MRKHRTPSRLRTLALILFAATPMSEYLTGPQQLVEAGPRPPHEWLAQQPGQFAIMQYLIGTALSGDRMLCTRYHGKRVVFGYGAYFPILFRKQHPELATFPSNASLDLPQEWEMRFVLLDLNALSDSREAVSGEMDVHVLEEIAQQQRLHYVGEFGHIQVYRLVR